MYSAKYRKEGERRRISEKDDVDISGNASIYKRLVDGGAHIAREHRGEGQDEHVGDNGVRRVVDAELVHELEQEEKKLIMDIQRSAKNGQMVRLFIICDVHLG